MNGSADRVRTERVDLMVDSSLLGALSVPPSQTYILEHGLLGFPNAHGFALVPTDREGLFWLQSMDFEALTFLVVDPFHFVDDYSVDLGREQLGKLATDDPSEILLLCILTLPREEGDQPSVNLQGPLAFNLTCGEGRQVVLQDSAYGTKHTLELDRRPAA